MSVHTAFRFPAVLRQLAATSRPEAAMIQKGPLLLVSSTPVVMEGDYLLPDLGIGFGEAVRAVVVSEPDEDRIVINYRSREAGAGEQRLRARVSALIDAELSIRAARVDVPVVAAWPWTDSLDRVDAALHP
jgi:hypothetical protein